MLIKVHIFLQLCIIPDCVDVQAGNDGFPTVNTDLLSAIMQESGIFSSISEETEGNNNDNDFISNLTQDINKENCTEFACDYSLSDFLDANQALQNVDLNVLPDNY